MLVLNNCTFLFCHFCTFLYWHLHEYLYIQLFEYVQKTLEQQEFEFFCEFVKTLNIKQTAKALNISLATAYRIHKRIKGVCEKFLLEC